MQKTLKKQVGSKVIKPKVAPLPNVVRPIPKATGNSVTRPIPKAKGKGLTKELPKRNKVVTQAVPVRKKLLRVRLSIRSRHPSIDPLRSTVFVPKPAVYRHGSTSVHPAPYEVNSIEAVQISSSKLRMKNAFDKGQVKHLPWMRMTEAKLEGNILTNGAVQFEFPVVVKHNYGSRGNGNYKIDTPALYRAFVSDHTDKGSYIVEKYFSGTAEFRVHITAYGPIYSLRKRLKSDTPKEKRWVRNDSTCVWITEFAQNKDGQGEFISFRSQDNPHFGRPANWNEIIAECKKALIAVGGDLLAVDVKAQSKKNGGPVDFYILEVNSAPAMGSITTEIYRSELPKILLNKYPNIKN